MLLFYLSDNLEKPIEPSININDNISKQKNSPELNQNQEKQDMEPKKDLMKERINELKSIYEQMIKLRKENLKDNKKLETSN